MAWATAQFAGPVGILRRSKSGCRRSVPKSSMSAPSSSDTRAPVYSSEATSATVPGGLRVVAVGCVQQRDGLVPGQARVAKAS
jgi:hypothetical protein